MFKNNRLAGVLNFRNGGSAPSIGGTTSLASALAGVERAEQALAAARALARSAAKREGHSVRGLFEDSQFILRATGERWADTARREGEKTIADVFCRNIDAESRDANSPFRHLAQRLKKIEDWPAHVAKMRAAMNDPRCERARALVEAGDIEEATALYAEVFQGTKADRILAAGKRARMSVGPDEVPDPPKGSVAAAIVRAGQRRRGEIQ
jgi:hypothetical protein